MAYFSKCLAVLACLSLAACGGGTNSLDLSSAVKDIQSTGVMYFGLQGDAITCRKPGLTFGKRQGDAFRVVDLGRKGVQHKDGFVRLRAPAGTYALLSVQCVKGNQIQTVGLATVGKDKGLYRSGLGLFTLSAGERINGGVVTTASPKLRFSSTYIPVIGLVLPMTADQKAKMAKLFPEATNLTDRPMQRETRTAAEKARADCVSNWIKDSKNRDLAKCTEIDPTRTD